MDCFARAVESMRSVCETNLGLASVIHGLSTSMEDPEVSKWGHMIPRDKVHGISLARVSKGMPPQESLGMRCSEINSDAGGYVRIRSWQQSRTQTFPRFVTISVPSFSNNSVTLAALHHWRRNM